MNEICFIGLFVLIYSAINNVLVWLMNLNFAESLAKYLLLNSGGESPFFRG